MRDLSRALVPLNYALRGPHLQDPAVTLPPVPLLSIAADLDVFDQDTIGFALATLLRGRNAALAAIDAADDGGGASVRNLSSVRSRCRRPRSGSPSARCFPTAPRRRP